MAKKMTKTRRDLLLMFSRETGNTKQTEIMLLDRVGLITSDYANWLEEKLIEKINN